MECRAVQTAYAAADAQYASLEAGIMSASKLTPRSHRFKSGYNCLKVGALRTICQVMLWMYVDTSAADV